jgi:NADPH-dependent 2,4-dienoyl-CoA reductase/sulfur reductase-like enzyme
VAPSISEFFQTAHTAKGIEILLTAKVQEIQAREKPAQGSGAGLRPSSAGFPPVPLGRFPQKVQAVLLDDGRRIPADLVVVGVGVLPNTELPAAAGLPIGNGIATDEYLRTPDERVFAIGDCAEYPTIFLGDSPGASYRVRLESVQNAVDQAVCVAPLRGSGRISSTFACRWRACRVATIKP